MNSSDEIFLTALLAALFAAVLFLRSRFPKASRSAQTMVLAAAVVLFIVIYHAFLPNDFAAVIVKSDVAHPSYSSADRIR